MSCWRDPTRPTAARLSIVFLVATLVMATMLGYSASDAARSQRSTAEKTLRDYAALAAWEYSRRVRASLDDMFHTPVHRFQSLGARPDAGRTSPAAVRAALRDDCECANGRRSAHTFVRVDLDRREVAAVGAAAGKLEWLVTALERRVQEDSGTRFAMVAGPSVTGAADEEDFGGFEITFNDAKQPTAAYGFLTSAVEVGRILREACSREGLLPPVLVGDVPVDSLVHLTISSPSGQTLFQTSVGSDSTYSARDTLSPSFAGLTVTAALLPELADRLIIGGLPKSRLPWVLGLLSLTLGVGLASLYQFRREQELAQLREQFVSGVSHELRTPLAQIRVFAELLEADHLRNDADRRRSIAVIGREARRLTHLIENVLHFSRNRRSAPRLALEQTPIGALIGETTEAFSPLARQREVRVVEHVPQPFLLRADRGVVGQILLNLLDNAVKYGPEGQTVRVVARQLGGMAELWVEDEGPGVPLGERGVIWEPYRRGSATARRENGCGIGLTLVAELAGLHGGSASVEPGQVGARFVVRLPGATAMVSPPEPRPEVRVGARV